jgi:hypothetical protein
MQPQPASRPRPLAGIVQVVIALFALGFAAFAIVEVGGEVKGWAKPFFIVPGILIALLAALPVRAAIALFRGAPEAQQRTETVSKGCGLPMYAAVAFGVIALIRSAAAREPITELLPYLVLIGIAWALVSFVAPTLARR